MTEPGARGLRISLAAATPVDGVGPVTMAPAPAPLAMLEASSGAALLGGLAIDASRGAPDASPGVLLDGEPTTARLRRLDREHALLELRPGVTARVLILPAEAGPGHASGVANREIVVDGWRIEVEVESAARAALRERARRGRTEAGRSGPTEVRAIIPGVVVGVSVAPGDAVMAGQQLLAVEAMKMQNELRAPRDGTVERVAVAVGQTIEVGDLLLVMA